MKNKILALIASLTLIISGVPCRAETDVQNVIYDLSFESDTSGFKAGTEIKIYDEAKSGSKSLYVKKYDDEENAPKLSATYLDRNSKTTASVYVKPIGSSDVTFKLVVYVNENNENKTYIIDQQKFSGQSWISLSGEAFMRYRNIYDAPEFAVIAQSGDDNFEGYLIDDFKIKSDKPTLNVYNPVEEMKNDGTFKMRFSFETGTIEKFLTTKSTNYTYVSPEYEITDEVPAHSGKYCLKISERLDASQILTLIFPNLPKNAKLNVSCWIRNANGIDKHKYILQGVIPVSDGKKWPWLSDYRTAEENQWIKLEGSLDTSTYTLVDSPMIRFSTTNESAVDYYIDDIVVRGDFEGEFYDDMNYKPREHDDTISDTPSKITPKKIPIQEDIPSLKDVYKDYFRIGAAITQDAVKPGRYENLFKKHCNSIVSENAFKMQNIIKNPKDKTNYNFNLADETMDFAYKNGIDDIVGHCFVWDITSAIPYLKNDDGSWMDRETALAFMKEYITKVMKHFEGDGEPSEYIQGMDYSNWHVSAWDVANEAASADTSDGYKLTGGSWINVIGKDYVDYAYEYATETKKDNGYDIELRYNDYGEENPKKRDAVYTLVKDLLDKGVNIEKLGVQSHYKPNTSSMTIRHAIEKYSSLGLPMDITELDIAAYTNEENALAKALYEDGIPKSVEFTQSNLYYELFDIYKEFGNQIDRVVTWTISDRLAYANYAKFIKEDYAGIFDRDYQAKPQFWAIADTKKYFNEILREDTSKTRIALDSKILQFMDDNSCFTENDTVYADVDEIFNNLGVKYIKKNNKITVIRNGKLIEMTVGSDSINSEFKMKQISAKIIEKDGRIYIPVIDICNELNFSSSFSDVRNMVIISGNEVGEAII